VNFDFAVHDVLSVCLASLCWIYYTPDINKSGYSSGKYFTEYVQKSIVTVVTTFGNISSALKHRIFCSICIFLDRKSLKLSSVIKISVCDCVVFTYSDSIPLFSGE
jgi:hypothetical protein